MQTEKGLRWFGMPDREKVIKGLEELEGFLFKEYTNIKAEESKIYYDRFKSLSDAIALLKEQDSLLGIQQTADGITFISTGTARQGEERGILLGKSLMHEWIYKELLYKGLLTDDIRSVFEQAKRI